jgi:hypothetical protein
LESLLPTHENGAALGPLPPGKVVRRIRLHLFRDQTEKLNAEQLGKRCHELEYMQRKKAGKSHKGYKGWFFPSGSAHAARRITAIENGKLDVLPGHLRFLEEVLDLPSGFLDQPYVDYHEVDGAFKHRKSQKPTKTEFRAETEIGSSSPILSRPEFSGPTDHSGTSQVASQAANLKAGMASTSGFEAAHLSFLRLPLGAKTTISRLAAVEQIEAFFLRIMAGTRRSLSYMVSTGAENLSSPRGGGLSMDGIASGTPPFV